MSKKERVALVSLLASLALTAAKLVVGLMIGSLALVTDALHSATDFVATLITFVAVRVADRPPDDDHPYGHGKYENVAAFAEATLLLLLAGGVTVEAWNRLGSDAPAIVVGWIPFVVMGVEIVVNAWRAYVLKKTAIETGSAALAADSLHFASDVGSSIAVVIGLIAAAYGIGWADPVAAFAVAVLIAGLALRMLKHTVDELTDKVPAGLVRGLTRLVEDIPGVVTVHHLRVRKVGPKTFVDASFDFPRLMTFDQITGLKARVCDTIVADLPGAETVVSGNPIAVDEETVRERVHLAAARESLPVHHVTILHLGDRLAVSVDLEVDGTMPLGLAHDEASRLEEAIRAEIGGGIEVETHLEPLHPDLQQGPDLTGERAYGIAAALKAASGEHQVTDVHDIRVRALGEGLFVAFHCRFDPSLPARLVHDRVDGLERAVRARFPEILRIVSHPEPIRSRG